MAPPSSDWQSLLRIQPTDVDPDNEAEEDHNEQLGDKYMKVGDSDSIGFDRNVFFLVESGWTR
jgi:hypothetical protein